MKHPYYSLFPFLLFLLPIAAPAQKEDAHPSSVNSREDIFRNTTLININNLSLWIQNDGLSAWNPHGKNWGLAYPRGTAGLVYTDGMVWVGKVQDGGQPVQRVGGGLWTVGTVPGVVFGKGAIEDLNNPSVRAFRIRSDYKTADLRRDAAEFFDTTLSVVTPEMIETLRSQYEKDWREWPWQKGAPFIDKNGNGRMDGDETPGFLEADQVIWLAYNDLDESVVKSFQGSPPIGLEVQVTIWGYKDVPEFKDVIFKRYRFFYKGASTTLRNSIVDSMYLCQWSDTDVGNYWDDLGGCDSLLSLGFAYNSVTPDGAYKPYDRRTPAVGYALLQGPVVLGSPSDEAVLIGQPNKRGMKNLPMTSFMLKPTPSFFPEPSPGFDTPLHIQNYWWNALRGYVPVGQVQDPSNPGKFLSPPPWLDPSGLPTKFPLAGDPATRDGWVDGIVGDWNKSWLSLYYLPGGRRLFVNTGPFRLALGDSQEIVIAVVAGEGADGRQSAAVVKHNTKLVRGIYPFLAEKAREAQENPPVQSPPAVPVDFFLSQNYPNPFNPSTTIEYTLPFEADVRLAIYDLLGREIAVLSDGRRPAGAYSVTWNARDNSDREVASGVYIYKIRAGYIELTRKMVIVR